MPDLALYLLGPPQIERGDVAIEISRRKAVALLVYLAMTGQPHSRDALATLLWPDFDQSRARGVLRRTLSILNKALAGSELAIERETIRLKRDASVWLDVEQFRSTLAATQTHSHPETDVCSECLPLLSEAAELYRDDFLAGFTLPDSPAFDEWQFFQSESLRRELASVLERLVEGHSVQGAFAAASEYARRRLALDPLHEPAQRQLMRLYAWAGQQAAALRQYQECVRVLDAELGVPPEEATTQLYETIKTKRLPLPGAEEPSPRRPRTPAPVPPGTMSLPPFLEQDTPREETPTVFVARARELSELEATLDTARAGAGQILFVIGGAGRGKTTLVQEFARRAQAAHADLVVVSGYCDAHTGVGDPYLPFREALIMLAGDVEAKWASGLITQQHARRLWETMPITLPALVSKAPDLIGSFVPGEALQERAATIASDDTPWFRQLAALTADEHSARLDQKRIFAQYAAVLKAIAAQRPLLFIMEDLHWVDTSSSGLLFHLSRVLGDSRILMVGTYRPEEVALSWDDERHPLAGLVSELKRQHGDIWLDLGDLALSEGRQFVDAYLDMQPNRLGKAFREALFGHTGGHALFTVELLRDMQERGDLRQDENGRWVAGTAIDWQTLPAKVEGVVEKRIERLEEELQAVLTVASVEGESFTAEVVARVQQLDERDLVRQLSRELDRRHRLVTAQALERLGSQRLSRYRFRHHLFQHYLYHSLDEMERAYLHEAVGNVLEALYEDRTGKVAVQLARHFEQAGLTEKAVDYLRQAGRRAVRLSANQEAIAHFSRGVTLLETLPDTTEHSRQEAVLHLYLGNAFMAVKGYSAPEAGRAFGRARALCEQLGWTERLFWALHGLFGYHLIRGELQSARVLGEQCLSLAQRVQTPKLLLEAHRVLGTALSQIGEFVPARAYLEQALTMYGPQHRMRSATDDPEIASLSHLARTLWSLGYPEQALRSSRKALSLGRELSHPFSLAYAHVFAANTHQLCRERQTAQNHAEIVINLATEQGFALWSAFGTVFRGWALGAQGQTQEGVAQMRHGLDAYRDTGANASRPYMLTLLAEVYGQAGQASEGLSLLAEALALVKRTDERFYEAETHRLQGELLQMQGADAAKIEACYRKAIDVARQQSAKSLELRATVSLARLWQRQGKTADAREMLAEIYGWFTEGFYTADLKEAQALLNGLS